MSNGHAGRRLWAPVVVVCGCLSLGVEGQQPEAPPPGRVLLSEGGLPPIDRGLRDQDLTGEPADRGRVRALSDSGAEQLPAGSSFLRGSVIVKFKAGAAGSAVSATMRAAAATGRTQPSHADFELLHIPLEHDPEKVAEELRQRSDVEYAQPRYVNRAMFRPNDPLYSLQWNWPALDMERAWDIQRGASNSIVVAVLDSGMAYRTATVRYQAVAFAWPPGGPRFPALGTVDVPFATAPELGDSSRFVSPRDFIWDDDTPDDLDGHGTHVAGTLGQLTDNNVGVAGMAFNVRLMPVKVISDVWDEAFQSPQDGTDDVVARGIRYAADNGARVINMSIGRTEGGPAPVVEEACRYAASRGVFIAVAGGNQREEENAPSRLAEIAPRIEGMMAVGAVGRDLAVAYYSTSNAYIDVAAPGGSFRGFGNSGGVLQQTIGLDLLHTYVSGPARLTRPRADTFAYYYFQGTSMATPHVSGLAALLMQQGIDSPAAIEAAIKQFATDKGTPGRDDEYGFGIINPRSTLRGLGLAR